MKLPEADIALLQGIVYPMPQDIEWVDTVPLWAFFGEGENADLYRVRFPTLPSGYTPPDDFWWVAPNHYIGRRPISAWCPLGRAMMWLALDEAATRRADLRSRLERAQGGIRAVQTPCPKCGSRDPLAVQLPDFDEMEVDREEGIRFGPILCDALVPGIHVQTGEPCRTECEAERGTLEETIDE